MAERPEARGFFAGHGRNSWKYAVYLKIFLTRHCGKDPSLGRFHVLQTRPNISGNPACGEFCRRAASHPEMQDRLLKASGLPEQLGDGDLLVDALNGLGEHRRHRQVLDLPAEGGINGGDGERRRRGRSWRRPPPPAPGRRCTKSRRCPPYRQTGCSPCPARRQ